MGKAHERTLDQVASIVGGTVVVRRPVSIRGVAGIEAAGPTDVTFYESPRLLAQLRASSAGAVLVQAPVEGVQAAQIQVRGRPYLRFIELMRVLHPSPRFAPGIDPKAVVHPEAVLGSGITVGPLAIIERGARIGNRTIVESHAYVGPGVAIGEDCHIYPHAVFRGTCHLGDRVFVHCGAVLGDDGFGYVRDDNSHVKIPHIGRVVVEDDVEIGANTTIDRATFGETRIGAGTKIDNLVMIAHNVRIGRRCILAAQVGIAGSSAVGDDTILAGQVGIASGVRVGSRAIATSKTGISGTVLDGETVSGIPAYHHRVWKRAVAIFWRLPEIFARLRALERHVGLPPPALRSSAGDEDLSSDRAAPRNPEPPPDDPGH